MRQKLVLVLSVASVFVSAVCSSSVRGGDGPFHLTWSEPSPPTLTQVARMIDCIQNNIANQGTVVIKQPDVWSQARMTKFRKEFEDQMAVELTNFQAKLSGRIARTDTAAFQSSTALGGVLNPFATPSAAGSFAPDVISTQGQLQTALTATGGLTADKDGNITSILPAPISNTGTGATAASFNLLNQYATGTDAAKVPGSKYEFGLEPNVFVDQKADYITHLARVRRNNLGDDNTDSAGYGMYMMRVPVSIQPGDKTVKGFGALVNVTMKHDFGPRFLPATYRNLVINDVVDLLGPVVQELIRSGDAADHHDAVQKYLDYKQNRTPASKVLTPSDLISKANEALETSRKIERDLEVHSSFFPVSRTDTRTYAIAPSDVRRVFVGENLLSLAWSVQNGINLGNARFPQTTAVRGLDVRAYLRQELEVAYDLMDGRTRQDKFGMLMEVDYIEHMIDEFLERKFDGSKLDKADGDDDSNPFFNLYEAFTNRLPGNTRRQPIGVLCWAIALDAGLLNRHLREDIQQTKGPEYTPPADVENMHFYVPVPTPDIDLAFQDFIRARWPMITFGLEPYVDQQNIEEAFSRKRDLALAISFALSTGRLSFRQAMQYQRQLQFESQAIDLNQTVAAFAHGSDSFGWRFSPRYQLPPEESNIKAMTNLLLRGGPGPKYQINNSKIEPGMREALAVVVIPSFIRGLRLDVSNDWYRLSDPDERKVHTAHAVELGRRINEAREALNQACACGLYRTEDTERLRAKLHMLEAQLPLQTHFVKVPYENTLGGFALFTQGTTALVPELSGHDGIQYYDATKPNDILVYGKHFSIYEMSVVAGGVTLLREQQAIVSGDPTTVGKLIATPAGVVTRDPQTNVLSILQPGGTFTPISNGNSVGTYDILSREVIRIHLPAGLNTTLRDDGKSKTETEVVELQVATPNGISNRLQIPVRPPGKVDLTAVGTAGYNFLNPNVALQFATTDNTLATGFFAVTDPTAVIRILPTVPTKPLPRSITLQVSVDIPSGNNKKTSILPTIPIKNVPLVGDAYVVPQKALQQFGKDLFTALKSADQVKAMSATQTYSTRLVVVTPDSSGAVPLPSSTTSSGLSITVDLVNASLPQASRSPVAPSGIMAGRNGRVTSDALSLPEAPEQSDGMVRRTSLARPTAASARFTQLPAIDPAAIEQKLADLQKAQTDATTKIDKLLASPPTLNLPPLPSQTFQHLAVVTPAAPTINVSVPVIFPPMKKHRLFSRMGGQANLPNAQNLPANVRGPLTERLLGRP
jgi:hypothetical protein